MICRWNNAPAHLAAQKNHIQVMEFLIPRINLEKDDNVTIELAAKYGHVEIMKLLKNVPGIDFNAKDSFCMRIAVSKSYISVIEFLLEIPAMDLSVRHYESIHLAANFKNVQALQMMAHWAIDQNKKDVLKMIYLHSSTFGIRDRVFNSSLKSKLIEFITKNGSIPKVSEWIGS